MHTIQHNNTLLLLLHRLLEIRRFFEDYKKNENKQVLVEDFVGAQAAKEAIIKVHPYA